MRKVYRSRNLYSEIFSWNDRLACGRVADYHILSEGYDWKDKEEENAEELHVSFGVYRLSSWGIIASGKSIYTSWNITRPFAFIANGTGSMPK